MSIAVSAEVEPPMSSEPAQVARMYADAPSFRCATTNTREVNSERHPVELFSGRRTKARFQALVAQWRQETRFIANVTTRCTHIAYQKVIGMGDAAVPFILEDLRDNGPDDWFWALHVITDENPITTDIAGDMVAMTEAWLEWGRKRGYL